MKYLSFILLLLCLQVHATNYYFAATGNNNNTGTSSLQSWATLDKLNSVTLSPGDHVFLRRGDVFTSPLQINQSGTPSNPIVFNAYGSGSMPVVTAFTTLTNWTNTSGNIWQASLDAGPGLNMLLIGGAPTMRGRYPNADAPNNGFLFYESHAGYTSITDNNYPISTNWTGATITMKQKRFQINSDPITSQDGGTFNYPGNSDTMQSEPLDNMGYFIQNHPGTLDQQGEWYYNPTSHFVQMYSNVNPGTLNVQAATKDYCLYAINRNYVTVENISFTGSNISTVFWSQGGYDTLRNCTFNYGGINGLQFKFHNHTCITGCTIDNTNNKSLEITPDATACTVSNNTIQHSGLIIGYAMREANGNQSRTGIFVSGNGVLVTGNYVKLTGYAGISATRDGVVISYNRVDSAVQVLDDAGGIYIADAPIYEVLRQVVHNVVTNCKGSIIGLPGIQYPDGSGIYDDEHGDNALIAYNVVYNCGSYGIFIHDSQYITIIYNKVFGTDKHQMGIQRDIQQPDVHLVGYRITNNIFVSTSYRTSLETFENDIFVIRTDGPFSDITGMGIIDSNQLIKPFGQNSNDFIRIAIGSSNDSTYTLSGWQAISGQDLHSKSDYSYPPYTLTNVGSELFPAGRFNSNTSGAVNEKNGYSNLVLDINKMDTGSVRVDTVAGTAGRGLAVRFYPGTNVLTFTQGHSYLVTLDVQGTKAQQSDFFATLRDNSNGNQVQVLKFKLTGNRQRVKLLFENIPSTLNNAYATVFNFSSLNSPTVWFDNVSIREVNVTYSDWKDYMDFKFAAGSPVLFTTPKPYLNQRKQRHAQQVTIVPYDANFFFTDPNQVRVKGTIKPRIR